MAVDDAGNVYISDGGLYCGGPGGHSIRKIGPDGIISTIAGTGEGGFSGDGGPATSAQLNLPMSVAVDGAGNLYIADLFNYRIRKVDADGIITTYAGTGERGSDGDGGPATEAELFGCCLPEEGFPGGMVVDDQGNLYIADGTRVRMIDTEGTITSVEGTDGGSAPYDVALDDDGNLYVSYIGGGRVNRFDANGEVMTIAGGPGNVSTADGVPATTALVNEPWGIAFGDGNLFIVEHRVSRVRLVGADGLIRTVAGVYHVSSGGSGLFNGEEGPATAMNLNEPIGLFVDSDGVLYIADAFNARIRAVYFAE